MNDNEIAEILREQNEEYRKLYEEHKSLEIALEEINKIKYLSAEKEMERKKVQKQKLLKKDRMAELAREYRKNLN